MTPVEACDALAVVFRLRPRARLGVHAAWIHFSPENPGTEVVGLALSTGVPAHPEVSRVAGAVSCLRACVVSRAAVQRARMACTGARGVLECVFGAHDAHCRLRGRRADCAPALLLHPELCWPGVCAAVYVVSCLEVADVAWRARIMKRPRRAANALALLGSCQRRVGCRAAQWRTRGAGRHSRARREGVESTRHERVEAGAEVAWQTFPTLKAWRRSVLPEASGAHTREDVCYSRLGVARLRRTLCALACPGPGQRRVLPRTVRTLDT